MPSCIAMMNPELDAFLLLFLVVSERDEEATRQALREVALNFERKVAHKIAHLVERSLDGAGRLWLSRLAIS